MARYGFGKASLGAALLEEAAKAGLLREEGGVRYYIKPATNRVILSLWVGKATATTEYNLYRTEVEALKRVAEVVKNVAASTRAKAERRAAAKVAKAALAETVTVGTIFCRSWGYEQTNIDYYEVVRAKGATVWVRKIASKQVEQTGYCSARVAPCPGQFIENAPELQKRVGQYGISFEHGASASVVKPGETHHCSWGH